MRMHFKSFLNNKHDLFMHTFQHSLIKLQTNHKKSAKKRIFFIRNCVFLYFLSLCSSRGFFILYFSTISFSKCRHTHLVCCYIYARRPLASFLCILFPEIIFISLLFSPLFPYVFFCTLWLI